MHRVERENCLCRTLLITFLPEKACAIIRIEMFDCAYDQLYMDSTTSVTRFVNDMLVHGQRKIGFIGDYEHCQSFYERYMAFRCAMLMADEPVDERFCIKTNSYEKLNELLPALSELPEVILCANDFIACDAIYILHKLGKSVPGDVLFCGFDDPPNSRIITPSLTTVHIHTQIMVFAAMQLLVSRIKEPELDFRIVHTATELIYRDSTRR